MSRCLNGSSTHDTAVLYAPVWACKNAGPLKTMSAGSLIYPLVFRKNARRKTAACRLPKFQDFHSGSGISGSPLRESLAWFVFATTHSFRALSFGNLSQLCSWSEQWHSVPPLSSFALLALCSELPPQSSCSKSNLLPTASRVTGPHTPKSSSLPSLSPHPGKSALELGAGTGCGIGNAGLSIDEQAGKARYLLFFQAMLTRGVVGLTLGHLGAASWLHMASHTSMLPSAFCLKPAVQQAASLHGFAQLHVLERDTSNKLGSVVSDTAGGFGSFASFSSCDCDGTLPRLPSSQLKRKRMTQKALSTQRQEDQARHRCSALKDSLTQRPEDQALHHCSGHKGSRLSTGTDCEGLQSRSTKWQQWSAPDGSAESSSGREEGYGRSIFGDGCGQGDASGVTRGAGGLFYGGCERADPMQLLVAIATSLRPRRASASSANGDESGPRLCRQTIAVWDPSELRPLPRSQRQGQNAA